MRSIASNVESACGSVGESRVTLAAALVDAWRQILVEGRSEAEIDGHTVRASRTSARGLRTVTFSYEGQLIDGIEQNPETTSRWAKLAQSGQRIMQFKVGSRYFANVCEGTLIRYPAWRALGLPD